MATDHVQRISLDGREIILIGTAHVSTKSAEEVKEVIRSEKPDTVCVELCPSRYQTITDPDKWKNTDIISIIKKRQAVIFLINLVLSSYQKRLAKQFGIQPGQEMIQGIASAKETGATLWLADRDIKTTLMRIWRGVGFWRKIKLIFQLLYSFLLSEDITEEELEKMKTQDMLTSILNELAESFPQFKTVLVDERDQYLAQRIRESPGTKVVAVLGAAHLPGVIRELTKVEDPQNPPPDLKILSQIPPASKLGKVLGWSIPILILILIASTFSVDKTAGWDQIVSWILWNGSLSALGTLLAFGHPLAILTAFVISPISSLNPLLAAGWFAGLMDAYIRKPNVEDFENIAEDIHTFRGFWKNKVTHVLLVVVLANVGSSLGALMGGADVIRHFLNTFF
ncbi:MAG TPA: TraB/GumN family protein [Peptococcaceae bacterium]|nr:TraB/GumN family protein [Peptococcaceae bacterium]